MSNLTYLLDIATNYVSFGLALYAIGSLLALIWMRHWNEPRSHAAMADVLRAGACVIALVMLEVIRQFWDTFHYRHFPLWITRAALPVLYFTLGNSIFRLVSTDANDAPASLVSSEAGRF